MKVETTLTPQDLVDAAVTFLDNRKAHDIVVLDVRELTSLADYFVIASGNNTTQVKTLGQEVDKKLKDHGFKPLHMEQEDGKSQWTLLDYGTVIIHIFYKETRKYYDLERLWADAPKQDVEEILSKNIFKGKEVI